LFFVFCFLFFVFCFVFFVFCFLFSCHANMVTLSVLVLVTRAHNFCFFLSWQVFFFYAHFMMHHVCGCLYKWIYIFCLREKTVAWRKKNPHWQVPQKGGEPVASRFRRVLTNPILSPRQRVRPLFGEPANADFFFATLLFFHVNKKYIFTYTNTHTHGASWNARKKKKPVKTKKNKNCARAWQVLVRIK
jgi:hypothetical protein